MPLTLFFKHQTHQKSFGQERILLPPPSTIVLIFVPAAARASVINSFRTPGALNIPKVNGHWHRCQSY